MKTEWPRVKLKEVLTRVERFEPRDELAEYPFAGTYSFARGIFVGERKLGSNFGLPKIQRIHEGDFVYCKIMAWEGAFGLVPREADNCVLSGAFVAYEPNRDRIDSKFLDYFFKVPSHWKSIGSQSSGTNVRRQSLHPTQFENAEVPLPPLAEQHRIVTRIEELSAKVEEARDLRQQTLEYQVPLLRNQMVRHVFRLDCEIEGHEAWPLVRLDDISSVITDGTHQTPRYVEEGMPFLSAQNVKPYRFMPEVHRKVSLDDYAGYTRRTKPEKGDVLMTRVGAMIGEAAMIDRDLDFAFYVSLCLIKPRRDRVHTPYLVHWLNSPFGAAAAKENTLGKGHSQGNLNLKLIREFTLPLPSIDEQVRLTERLDEVEARISEIRTIQSQTANELDSLMPSILDKAFQGEL